MACQVQVIAQCSARRYFGYVVYYIHGMFDRVGVHVSQLKIYNEYYQYVP